MAAIMDEVSSAVLSKLDAVNPADVACVNSMNKQCTKTHNLSTINTREKQTRHAEEHT